MNSHSEHKFPRSITNLLLILWLIPAALLVMDLNSLNFIILDINRGGNIASLRGSIMPYSVAKSLVFAMVCLLGVAIARLDISIPKHSPILSESKRNRLLQWGIRLVIYGGIYIFTNFLLSFLDISRSVSRVVGYGADEFLISKLQLKNVIDLQVWMIFLWLVALVYWFSSRIGNSPGKGDSSL